MTSKAIIPGAPGCRHRIDLNRITGNKPLSFFTGREHVQPEYPGIVKATGTDVNIRSGAGTQYKILGEAEKGRPFERRPGDTAEWYAIRYLGQDAFISKKYAKEAQG